MKKNIPFFLALFLTILIIKNSYSEPRRVLIEFSTGTWCQYCPCADSIVEKIILVRYPQTVVLAYHGNIASGDPYAFFNGHNIDSLLGIWGYPIGVVDRRFGYPQNCDYWLHNSKFIYRFYPSSVIDLTVASKNYNPSTRELTVTINATATQNLYSNYRINFVILENNLVYPQAGNPSQGCVGGRDYIHRWVVRNMVNNAPGDSLKYNGWAQNQIVTKTFSTIIDESWVTNNCEFVIFAYRDSIPLNKSIVEQSLKQSLVTTGIFNGNNPQYPVEYKLEQNYPNPFNPVTRIIYSIPKSQKASLKIYNILGNQIMTVFDGHTNAGTFNAEIDGTQLPSGVYYYTLITEDFIQTKKMVLSK